MEYFNRYTSNTLAGSGNQHIFKNKHPDEVTTGRVFYKIFTGGCYHYSILFSNIIDSTYADGSQCHKNVVCDQWQIESLELAICDSCNCEEMVEVGPMQKLTFSGSPSKTVMPGEFFHTDEVLLDVKKGQYICLQMAFRGEKLPYHPESLLPIFVLEDGNWVPSKEMPVPGMIGCDRPVERRVAFLGDSITQGIGTVPNSYAHWNACLAERLGPQDAYWNLGIGYGRADDAASDGAWLFKAKQADVVMVCFGVNDILQGFEEKMVIKNLKTIAESLRACDVKVIIQTVPPFDYDDEKRPIWENVNHFIQTELAKEFFVFDNVPVLCDEKKGRHVAKYGGHPDAEGCALWAKAFYEALRQIDF